MQSTLWQSILGELELIVTHANFETWFRSTELISYDDSKVVIGVANIFAQTQFERKFDKTIREVLKKNNINNIII